MLNSLRPLVPNVINGDTGIIKIVFVCEDNYQKISGNF